MAITDLIVDLGEGDPYDKELLQTVSSCNVACGRHPGDVESMPATVRMTVEYPVSDRLRKPKPAGLLDDSAD